MEECIAIQKTGNLPQYYDESSIVSLLEKTGIGRPSTYSTIVSILDNRKYTEKRDFKEDDKDIKTLTLQKMMKLLKKKKPLKVTFRKKNIDNTIGYKGIRLSKG